MDCPVKPGNDIERGRAMTQKSRAMTEKSRAMTQKSWAMTSPPVILGLDPRIQVCRSYNAA